MCGMKLLMAGLLMTLLNVIFADPDIKSCVITCDENSNKTICLLNKKEICFRTLSSMCDIDRNNCPLKTDYAIYADTYCDLENFMCKPIFQSPPLDVPNP